MTTHAVSEDASGADVTRDMISSVCQQYNNCGIGVGWDQIEWRLSLEMEANNDGIKPLSERRQEAVCTVVRKSLLRGGWIGDEPPYPVPDMRTGDALFNAIWQVVMAAGARVPPQSIREVIAALRTEIQKAAPDAAAEIARLKAADAIWRDNLRALWAALRMIREAVEELGPAGAVPSEESILPEPHHEAEAIITGIQAIAGRHVRTTLSVDPETGQEIVTVESPAEVASWFFPDEEDDRREALRKAIEELIEKR